MSTYDTTRTALGGKHATRMLCDEVFRTLETYEPTSAATLSGLRSLRAPRGQSTTEVVVTGRANSGTSGLIEALNAINPHGPVVFREWDHDDDNGIMLPIVLMLFDAAGPIGSTELGELRRLNKSVDKVVFAITKTDMHLNWRQVRDRDAQLLAIHTPRFTGAEIHPVATPLVHAANDRRDADPHAAQALAESAGVDALHAAVLENIPAPGTDYVARNVLWGITAALQEAQATRQRIGRDIQNNPEINKLHRIRAELLRKRGVGRSDDLTAVRADIQRGRVELGHSINEWARTTAGLTRSEIDALDGAALGDYPARVRSLTRVGHEQNNSRTEKYVGTLFDKRSLPAPEKPAPDVAEREQSDDATPPQLIPKRGSEDYIFALVGASAGVGLGRLIFGPLSLMPTLDLLTIPLTLILGIVVALWMLRVRRHVTARGRLREWTAEQLAHARAHMERHTASHLVNAEQQLAAEISRIYDEKIADTDRQVAQIETQIRALTGQRDSELAVLTAEINDITAAVERSTQLLQGPRDRAEPEESS
ncbi:hypothetical protein IEU95_12575 [Hoyosella rhizosphaerae]|uniref:G domain-containing protein n=1 Tax=Hoyosella rhizosphaerae TaxID=1755582 RepID=A0A916U7S4_9ACTN|nr:hypothetical protein [Hoyosella rhizosphaerae]MBN4927671.1 hypothetical protein [Hoyosella rhizosphaerae]GGC62615.1 hypothetical protein GCM10011410_13800 [Hoyosella rhizosphaerae]